jgi:hypothetical protein
MIRLYDSAHLAIGIGVEEDSDDKMGEAYLYGVE